MIQMLFGICLKEIKLALMMSGHVVLAISIKMIMFFTIIKDMVS